MQRRLFLGAAAAASAAPSRKIGKVEILFKTPGPHPNGLQATDEGLWIIDQANNYVEKVVEERQKEMEEKQDRLEKLEKDMKSYKTYLYAKFGSSINLEEQDD